MQNWILIVVAVVAVSTLGFTAYAQNSEPIRFEGESTQHEAWHPMYIDHEHQLYWIWNPQNATFTYDNNKTANPTHVGHWDVFYTDYTDPENGQHVSFKPALLSYIDHGNFVMNLHWQNVTDMQALEIAELQAQNQDMQDKFNTMQYQLDKQAKKINQLEAALQDGK